VIYAQNNTRHELNKCTYRLGDFGAHIAVERIGQRKSEMKQLHIVGMVHHLDDLYNKKTKQNKNEDMKNMGENKTENELQMERLMEALTICQKNMNNKKEAETKNVVPCWHS